MAINYEKYIVDVPDFPKPGILFKDITPLFENPEALKEALEDMKSKINTLSSFNKIICADARGFLFGAPLALDYNVPLVLARKPGKLPRAGISASYALEYGENTLEISRDSILSGDKVLIVDDLLATGGSTGAIKEMVEKCGALVVGIATLIELDELKGRQNLHGTEVVSCLHY